MANQLNLNTAGIPGLYNVTFTHADGSVYDHVKQSNGGQTGKVNVAASGPNKLPAAAATVPTIVATWKKGATALFTES